MRGIPFILTAANAARDLLPTREPPASHGLAAAVTGAVGAAAPPPTHPGTAAAGCNAAAGAAARATRPASDDLTME